jgi:hypothetical protein
MIDELELLRAWAPPDEDADADAAAAGGRARARLDAHVAAAPRRRRRGRPAPARRRWWLVAAPVAVAVAVALVVALGSGVQEGRVVPAPATAAQALEQAAHAAERQAAPEVFPRPDQFFYTRTSARYLSCRLGGPHGFCALADQEREAWISLDRRGSETTRVTGHAWPSEAERRKWVAAGRPPVASATAGTFGLHANHAYYLGNERLSYEQMRDFDQDGAALFRRLRDGVVKGQGGSLYGEVFTQIGDALREQPAPPRLRAALFRALKHVPGVQFIRATQDRLGRPAVAVGRTARGIRRDLLFDPRTSEMLAEREVVVGDVPRAGFRAARGTVIGDAVYRQRGVVGAIGRRP